MTKRTKGRLPDPLALLLLLGFAILGILTGLGVVVMLQALIRLVEGR